MATAIERLLRLVADYHNFCSNDDAMGQEMQDSSELSIEDLDNIAAASAVVMYGHTDTSESGNKAKS